MQVSNAEVRRWLQRREREERKRNLLNLSKRKLVTNVRQYNVPKNSLTSRKWPPVNTPRVIRMQLSNAEVRRWLQRRELEERKRNLLKLSERKLVTNVRQYNVPKNSSTRSSSA
jgi:hypothetical protein